MSQNYEIKASYDRHDFAEEQAIKIGAELLGTDFQTDTYFSTRKGKLKLRETSLAQPYLIPYLRPSDKHITLSKYEKISVENAASVKQLFTELLGQQLQVRKKRIIYIYENVRIHLDQVEELGSFIELEAVVDPKNSSEKIEKEKIKKLMDIFQINDHNLLSKSYYELIQESREKN